MTQNLKDTKNCMTQGKRTSEQKGVLAILRFSLGAGVTPAEGSLKPTVGFKFNYVNRPLPIAISRNFTTSSCIARLRRIRSSVSGILYVQFHALIVPGRLICVLHPNKSWIGTITSFDGAA